MVKKEVSTDVLLANIIKGIEEVKGNDIDILDLREIDTAVCDYFVICNGNSNTQVNAIVHSIQKIFLAIFLVAFFGKGFGFFAARGVPFVILAFDTLLVRGRGAGKSDAGAE